MRRFLGIALIFFLPLLLATTCETNNRELIPYMDININLTINGSLADLGPEGTKLIDGGVNGIILYRDSYDNYYAFDRTCTMWPSHDEAVEEDADLDGVFTCPDCGSSFMILDGTVYIVSGPASQPLVQYATYIEGTILHVYN